MIAHNKDTNVIVIGSVRFLVQEVNKDTIATSVSFVEIVFNQ